MAGDKRYRVMIAKVGLDGHDRGAKVVAQALRDAGFEVIYTGIRQKPAEVIRACIEEDVQCLGLSSLSGGHMSNFQDVVEELKAKNIFDDIVLFAGGVIPDDDRETLLGFGFSEVYQPGVSLEKIVSDLHSKLEDK
jgi:methylmalonyl-CoA mutase, C-terminal domain